MWDESKHPRKGKGDPEGGQFAPGGGSGVVSATTIPGEKGGKTGAKLKDRLKAGDESWGRIGEAHIAEYNKGAIANHKMLQQIAGVDDAESIYEYVFKDKRNPKTAAALDRLVKKTKPLSFDITSYRGLRVNEDFVQNIETNFRAKGSTVLVLPSPSSFSNSPGVAWMFAKPKGPRRTYGSLGVVLRVLVPKGTPMARLNMAFGVGYEHVLPSGTRIHISAIDRSKTRVTMLGEVVNA